MIVNAKTKQGSEEWHALRKGRATASEFKKIMTPTGKPSASAKGYMRKLARECVVDDPLEFMGNKYMDWGNEFEPEARELFREKTGLDAQEVGFVTRDDKLVGCSPDSLIMGEDGEWIAGLEIKCPQVDNHVEILDNGTLPDDYKLQVHGGMAVTGLDSWWFMSYFPGLPPLIILVERDDFTEMLGERLDEFVIDYAEERKRLLALLLENPVREEELV